MATITSKHRGQTTGNTDGTQLTEHHDRDEMAQRVATLNELVRKAQVLEREARELHEHALLARGTQQIRPLETSETVPEAPVPAPTPSPLYQQTEALLCDKPHTFRDLCTVLKIAANGENSLKSVLVRLQRDGRPVVNLGNGSRAIWWIDVHDRIGQITAGRPRVMSAKAK